MPAVGAKSRQPQQTTTAANVDASPTHRTTTEARPYALPLVYAQPTSSPPRVVRIDDRDTISNVLRNLYDDLISIVNMTVVEHNEHEQQRSPQCHHDIKAAAAATRVHHSSPNASRSPQSSQLESPGRGSALQYIRHAHEHHTSSSPSSTTSLLEGHQHHPVVTGAAPPHIAAAAEYDRAILNKQQHPTTAHATTTTNMNNDPLHEHDHTQHNHHLSTTASAHLQGSVVSTVRTLHAATPTLQESTPLKSHPASVQQQHPHDKGSNSKSQQLSSDALSSACVDCPQQAATPKLMYDAFDANEVSAMLASLRRHHVESLVVQLMKRVYEYHTGSRELFQQQQQQNQKQTSRQLSPELHAATLSGSRRISADDDENLPVGSQSQQEQENASASSSPHIAAGKRRSLVSFLPSSIANSLQQPNTITTTTTTTTASSAASYVGVAPSPSAAGASIEPPIDPILDPLTASFSSMGTSTTTFVRQVTTVTDTAHQLTDSEGFTTINNYVLVDDAGAGKFGKVVVASVVGSGELRAIKIVPKRRLRSRWQELLEASGEASDEATGNNHVVNIAPGQDRYSLALYREVAILKRLRHKNIVQLFEVIDDPTDQMLYLVMKYIEKGPIVRLDAQWRCPPLDIDLVRCIARQAAHGVAYLHRHHIAHRDIKPDNILLGADGVVYLSDFGVSEIFDHDDDNVRNSDGTPAYAAPEIVRGGPYHAMKADIWALGVTIYTLVFGCSPFFAPSIFELNEKIVQQPVDYSVRGDMSHDVDYDVVVDLLQHMLERDPEKRITAVEVAKHAFISHGRRTTIAYDDSISGAHDDVGKDSSHLPMLPPHGTLQQQHDVDIPLEEAMCAISQRF